MSPVYLRHGDEFVAMTERPYEAESVLQALLAEHPEVLAAGDRDAERDGWVLVRREAGIADAQGAASRWSLDHLFLDAAGVPTLVEVKRSVDTRARREVVAQMLDYAANATAFWQVDLLQGWFELECVRRDEESATVLQTMFGVTDPASYWAAVHTNLNADRIRLVFVADDIPPELRSIVELLNRQMRDTEVIAIEVKQYTDAHGQRSTIVPRVIGQTEAARAAKRPGKLGVTTGVDLARAPAAFHELLSRMDDVASDLGLIVKPVRTGRSYQPPVLETGVTYTTGIGVYATGRGAEFNLGIFRELGADDVADDLLARLRAVAGRPIDALSSPSVSCEALIEDWPRTRAELIEPYFAARSATAQTSTR